MIRDFSQRSLFIYNLKVTLSMENEAERQYETLLCIYNSNVARMQEYSKGTLVPCESYHSLDRRGCVACGAGTHLLKLSFVIC